MTNASDFISDCVGYLFCWIAHGLSYKKFDRNYSFGMGRIDLLGQLIALIFKWFLAIWLVIESIDHLSMKEYHDIDEIRMLILAGGAFLGHILIGVIIYIELPVPSRSLRSSSVDQKSISGDSESSVQSLSDIKCNEHFVIRTSRVAIIFNIIQSILVLIAAILIYLFDEDYEEIKILDYASCFTYTLFIIIISVLNLREILLVLMEGTPRKANMDVLEKSIRAIPEVDDMHDFHLWSLSAGKVLLTCHIWTNNHISALKKITDLCRIYGIFHTTIQLEDASKKGAKDYIRCYQNLHN